MPRNAGIYWGFEVEVVESMAKIFDKDKYDLIIGFGEEGDARLDSSDGKSLVLLYYKCY